VIERAEISLRALSLFKMVEKSYGGSKAIPIHTKVCSILAYGE
tara:strand:- start:1432 stop:1560 length:129 start_codon:yes stop_codon:yes gene_type:complete